MPGQNGLPSVLTKTGEADSPWNVLWESVPRPEEDFFMQNDTRLVDGWDGVISVFVSLHIWIENTVPCLALADKCSSQWWKGPRQRR